MGNKMCLNCLSVFLKTPTGDGIRLAGAADDAQQPHSRFQKLCFQAASSRHSASPSHGWRAESEGYCKYTVQVISMETLGGFRMLDMFKH